MFFEGWRFCSSGTLEQALTLMLRGHAPPSFHPPCGSSEGSFSWWGAALELLLRVPTPPCDGVMGVWWSGDFEFL
jgi:hypothetical protein